MDGEYPVGGENQNISGISAVVRGTRKKRERQRNGVLICIFQNCCVVEVTVVSDEVSSAGLMVVITVIMLQVAAITSGPHLGHPTPPLPLSRCSLQYTSTPCL